MNYIEIEPDPNAPPVPPAYDPNPSAYSDIKPEITETYDILGHNRGRVHPPPPNDGTYSRLNIEGIPVYDTCQHNGDATTKPQLLQSHHGEYSQLNVGQQTS